MHYNQDQVSINIMIGGEHYPGIHRLLPHQAGQAKWSITSSSCTDHYIIHENAMHSFNNTILK